LVKKGVPAGISTERSWKGDHSMQSSDTISSEKYDLIVIGSGMGGLTAAALLAKEGRKVLVLEQKNQPGGYCRTFRSGSYAYDRALHLIMGCARSSPLGIGVINNLLLHLGVRDKCEFIRVDPLFTAHFPDYQLQIPGRQEPYLQTLVQQFPSDVKGIMRLADLCTRIYREMMEFPVMPGIMDMILTIKRQPKLFRHANATLSTVLDAHLSDPHLKAICASLWPYLGAPPSRVSFLTWAAMMAIYLEGGAFYCRGGFQNLADAVCASLLDNGGELVLNSRVKSIRVRKRKVYGVELEDGSYVRSPIIISNIDAKQTLAEFVPQSEQPQRYIRKMNRMTITPYIAKMYLGSDLDISSMGVTHENASYTSWKLEETSLNRISDRISGAFVTIPTLTDNSLAPPGKHVVILSGMVDPDANPETDCNPNNPIFKMLLDGGETILPGLREHITDHGDCAILGPVYGWEATPKQSGAFRLGHVTPISGLYLCGQWTQPGHGIWTVVLSGIRTARIIQNKNTSKGMSMLDL
jgi:phytoene dehydrogenase-like protein